MPVTGVARCFTCSKPAEKEGIMLQEQVVGTNILAVDPIQGVHLVPLHGGLTASSSGYFYKILGINDTWC